VTNLDEGEYLIGPMCVDSAGNELSLDTRLAAAAGVVVDFTPPDAPTLSKVPPPITTLRDATFVFAPAAAETAFADNLLHFHPTLNITHEVLYSFADPASSGAGTGSGGEDQQQSQRRRRRRRLQEGGSGTWARAVSPLTLTQLTQDVTHTLAVRTRDSAGNAGPAVTHRWHVASTAPTSDIVTAPARFTSLRTSSFRVRGVFNGQPLANVSFALSAKAHGSGMRCCADPVSAGRVEDIRCVGTFGTMMGWDCLFPWQGLVCGVVWCGVVWCGVVWRGVAWRGAFVWVGVVCSCVVVLLLGLCAACNVRVTDMPSTRGPVHRWGVCGMVVGASSCRVTCERRSEVECDIIMFDVPLGQHSLNIRAYSPDGIAEPTGSTWLWEVATCSEEQVQEVAEDGTLTCHACPPGGACDGELAVRCPGGLTLS